MLKKLKQNLSIEYMAVILMDKKVFNNLKDLKNKKRYFNGIVAETILSKELFPANKDLKEYIKLFEKFEGIDEYRPYLYKARTLLIARIIKDVNYKLSDQNFLNLVEDHNMFFNTANPEKLEVKIDEKIEKNYKSNDSLFIKYINAKRKNNTDD